MGKAIDKAAGAERTEFEEYNRYHDGIKRTEQPSSSSVKLAPTAHSNTRNLPATPAAAQWEGYKSALKPSYEAILVCRAPRAGNTFANLALEYGTGSFNIDGSRIAVDENDINLRPNAATYNYTSKPQIGITGIKDKRVTHDLGQHNSLGRYPANVLFAHDPACTDARCVPACPVKQLGDMSGELTSGEKKPLDGAKKQQGIYGDFNIANVNYFPPSQGTAARFYYCAKVQRLSEHGLMSMASGSARTIQL